MEKPSSIEDITELEFLKPVKKYALLAIGHSINMARLF